MMPITIDPHFSVFSIISVSHSRRLTTNYRYGLATISYEIENTVIHDHIPARGFAGFQHMSAFLTQIERYRKLAENAQHVWVFGIPDVTPPEIPNITYVLLSP